MKRVLFSIACTLPLLLLTSCGPAAQPSPAPYGRAPAPAPLNRPDTRDQQLPQLKDGPESIERDPDPVSNALLQREYPQLITMSGPSTSNMVALTWDDGPDRRFTPQILDVLRRHNVRGTFFVMGSRANVLPDVIRRMHQEGHAIGNHSYWHPNFGKGNVASMRWEINQTDNVIQRITGTRPVLVRPPYGNITEDEVRELGALHKHMVGWNVDSLDWRQLPADEVERNVLGNVRPGSIILMHSGGNWNQSLQGGVNALDNIITELQDDGMQFVTVPEMLRHTSVHE